MNRIYFQSETTLETVLCFPFKMACKVADDKLTRPHFLKTLITRQNLHARVIYNVLLFYSIIHAGLPLSVYKGFHFASKRGFIKVRFRVIIKLDTRTPPPRSRAKKVSDLPPVKLGLCLQYFDPFGYIFYIFTPYKCVCEKIHGDFSGRYPPAYQLKRKICVSGERRGPWATCS